MLVNDIWDGDARTERQAPFWELSTVQGSNCLSGPSTLTLSRTGMAFPRWSSATGGLVVEIDDGDTPITPSLRADLAFHSQHEYSDAHSEFSCYRRAMLARPDYLRRLEVSTARAPVTALLGPRQCGKTTLAREFAAGRNAMRFDLESEPDVRQLANPELVLGSLGGLVVLDEVQRMPELFSALRVLVDRPGSRTRFLILGSAAPDLVRGVSETLAGRVELIEMSGFGLEETGMPRWRDLWVRGGFPRSYLAASDDDSRAWRNSFVSTFLERDLPQLGISIPAAAMRRFWTMLAHSHGQRWNASNLGRAMSLSDKTVRRYLDLLTGAFMVRQLQPWFQNIAKRQVKAPKVYLRDTGLLHTLLGIPHDAALLSHPRVGASWEGFVIEQLLRVLRPADAWFWAAHGGGEVDLLATVEGRWTGFEVKFNESPSVSRTTRASADALELDHLFVVCPAPRAYPVSERIAVVPLWEIGTLRERIGRL